MGSLKLPKNVEKNHKTLCPKRNFVSTGEHNLASVTFPNIPGGYFESPRHGPSSLSLAEFKKKNLPTSLPLSHKSKVSWSIFLNPRPRPSSNMVKIQRIIDTISMDVWLIIIGYLKIHVSENICEIEGQMYVGIIQAL